MSRTHARTNTHIHSQGNKITRILQVYITAASKTCADRGCQIGCHNWKGNHQRTPKEEFPSLNTMLVSRIVCPSTIYRFFGIYKRYFMCEVWLPWFFFKLMWHMVLLRHIWLNDLARINYSEFVLIRGVPMFVDFVDTVVSHHETNSICVTTCICIYWS